MYVWQAISTVCVMLWMLQRSFRRTSGTGSALSNGSLVGGAECKPPQYDVFINYRGPDANYRGPDVNYRGPDVEKTFVAHLDDALRRGGFRPFLDTKDIAQGHHVFKSIDEALNAASVHVAVFSKGYAESEKCLNELCDMLTSGQRILPVFYDVSPDDLRSIKNGPFKEGFEEHIKCGRGKEVRKWKEALSKVADIRGFQLDEVNGNEMQLIRSILVAVQSAMPPTKLPAKHCYGMEELMKDVLKRLESLSALGLFGMGGIGKTTLATEIYNHYVSRGQFDRYCFLKDVRSTKPSQLQHDLLKDLGHRSELACISPQDYKRAFDSLAYQRVLVVVDDIDDSSQFEALIPDIKKFGSGSRIVITSRLRDVLNSAMAGATSRQVYEVPPLNECDSRLLFNRRAFLSETPSEGKAELAEKVADACGGIALVLETIGASLFGEEDMEIWSEAVKSLQGNKEIFGKLRSIYDRLPSDGDKAMFRDIACLLINMEKEVALTFWKSCGSCSRPPCSTSITPVLALRTLMDRSLVKVDEYGRLRMHDVLRDMGRDIVKEEAGESPKWTHLWDPASAAKALGYNKTNNRTRGINIGVEAHKQRILTIILGSTMPPEARMGKPKDCAVSCEASQLTNMKELHLLILDGCDVIVPDGFSSWPRELRWLQWKQCGFASLPSYLKLPKLVVLDLSYSDELIRLWENDAHVQLPLLQTLDLTYCVGLEELPENIGHSVPKLKRLLMRGCYELRRVPDSIGHLTDLEHLCLGSCGRELVSLPDTIVGLVSLRTLILGYSRKLQQLPEELGKLSNLETLDVSFCSALSKLPASMGGLRMLKTLDMNGTMVKELPVGFGLLASLTALSMKGLRSVPETFQGLQALTSLEILNGSGDLGGLGALAALKHIRLLMHATITTLPKSLQNLKRLVRLHVTGCPELLTVKALPEGLEELDLSGCPKLTEIPSLAAMRCLVRLCLRDCESLKHVYGLECVTTLEVIDVLGCSSIKNCRINGMVNKSLRRCDVSRSTVSVAYNNRWLEREPDVQVISWFGDAIVPLSNGIAIEPCLAKREDNLVLEATISSEAKCVALIWCLVTSSSRRVSDVPLPIPSRRRPTVYGFSCKVEVWRGKQLVVESRSFPGSKVCFRHNTVHLYTLRREHHVVQSLRLKDKICVYLNPHSAGNLTVAEGGVCVVHNEDGKLVLAMNSEMLGKRQSENLAAQFGQLCVGGRMGGGRM